LVLAAAATGSVLGSRRAAAQVFGPCGGIPPGQDFIECIVFGTRIAYGNGVATGGDNSFLLTTPVRVVGNPQLGLQGPFVFTNSVPVTWDPRLGPMSVTTRLRLDGAVNIFQQNASVTLDFQGLLGGVPTNCIGLAGACPAGVATATIPVFTQDATLGILTVNRAADPGTPATSVLTVTIVGGASYTALGSPLYAGSVPEPGTIGLLGTGLLALVGAAHRRKSVRGG
jgi:hypothetical protein